MSEQCVILKDGDFALPYTTKDGICVYPNKRTAEQSRKPGDVVVAYEDWKDWGKRL